MVAASLPQTQALEDAVVDGFQNYKPLFTRRRPWDGKFAIYRYGAAFWKSFRSREGSNSTVCAKEEGYEIIGL